jgi:hypothetical protein
VEAAFAGSVLSQGRATMVSRPQVVSELFDDHLTTTTPLIIIVSMAITLNADLVEAFRWVWSLPPANAVIAQSVVANHGCATTLEEEELAVFQRRRPPNGGTFRKEDPWCTSTHTGSLIGPRGSTLQTRQ